MLAIDDPRRVCVDLLAEEPHRLVYVLLRAAMNVTLIEVLKPASHRCKHAYHLYIV